MLTTNQVTKWVNSGIGRIYLLRDINMSIAQGEFVSIMGPSDNAAHHRISNMEGGDGRSGEISKNGIMFDI